MGYRRLGQVIKEVKRRGFVERFGVTGGRLLESVEICGGAR